MRYLFPPRPKSKTTLNDLPLFEKMGNWVVQRKFNGTRNLIFVDSCGVVQFFNRYGRKHTRYQPSKELISAISLLNLDRGKDYILDGELMNRQKNASEMIVLYDVLMCGRYLFSHPNQDERLKILRNICGNPTIKNDLGFVVAEQLTLAEHWERDFVAHFQDTISHEKLEGLVLRKKNVGLDNLGYSEYETNSLIRCRKPIDKGYNF